MSKNIDFSKMVILQKLDNTTTTGEKGNNSLFTSDYIKLNSYEEVKNIPENERIKTLTDFALMNYSWQSSLCDTARDKRAGAPWLRSAYSSNIVRFIDYDGSLGWDNVRARSLSLCPALYLNLESYISARSAGGGKIDILHKKIDKKTKHFINIGEYPKTKVPQNLFLELENQYQGGMLKPELQATGRLYTTNGQREYGEDFLSKQNPEFIYKGKKYVRVIVWNDSKNHIYEDGTIVPKTGSVEWVKVEPVTFEIKNWEQLPKSINSKGKRFGADKYLELETEEAILSGLPFYPTYDHDNCSMWQNSLVRAFLNSANSKQIDGNSQYKAEYQWDFTNSGFLQQALNLTREPTVEYIIPDNEHEICAHAFEGCIGINKIYIPSHVTKLGDYAFAGLNNTQICFETGTKQISNIENAFLDKHYTNINSYMYIYLSKDKKHVTISHQIDQKLENGSYRLDFSIEQLKDVDEIIVIGWSAGDVDIPYLCKVRDSVISTTKWKAYYYNDNAKKGLEFAFQSNSIHNYKLAQSELFWDC